MNKFKKPGSDDQSKPARKSKTSAAVSEKQIEQLIAEGERPVQQEVEHSVAEKAQALIKQHALLSTGIGLVPLPLIDMASITVNQLVLLQRLAQLYQVPFKKNLAKSLISVLVYDLAAHGVIGGTSSLLKGIPIVGSVVGGLTLSATSGAITYAIGQVFLQHFESGGTFLNFDAEQMKAYFHEFVKK
ncbi:MAG: YcjF family protein [Flammeovirgaceae bacterium]